MIEKEINPNALFTFSFICPKGRESEVIETFLKSNLGLITGSVTNKENNWLDTGTGTFTTISGTRFDGITTNEGVKNIVNSLSEKKIAAYSRQTQVFFKPYIGKDK